MASILREDVPADVAATYRRHLEDGKPDREATQLTLSAHADHLADEDDAPLVWIGLAVIQHQLGRPDAEVLARALEILPARLAGVRALLERPAPKRKSVRPPKRLTTNLVPGDILVYRAPGRVYAMRVVELQTNRYFTAPSIALLAWEGLREPTLEEAAACADLRSNDEPGPTYHAAGMTPLAGAGGDWSDNGFELLGRVEARPPRDIFHKVHIQTSGGWRTFARSLDAWSERPLPKS